jgi:outer membrane protein assembly factor BamB
VATTAVPKELRQAWQTVLGGRLTQPVVAGGRVVLASVDEGIVYALDEPSGKRLWKYVAGGRVDSPPTVYGGRVLFGSADGWVHCLRLSDGQAAWRFLAAPAELRTVALDRVESVWPVHGSVLVLDDVAYCSAGRSTWLDGGIDLYGLDPATGKVLYKTHFESRHPQFQECREQARPEHDTQITQNVTDYKTFLAPDQSDAFSMAGGAVSDVLVSDGTHVYLHQVKFTAKLEKQADLSRHLFSTASLLDDAENHRSHWVLGTGDFSRVPVAYSWIVDRPAGWTPTVVVPTGVQIVFDDGAVWGVRNLGNANGKYELFKKTNRPFSPGEKSEPDFRSIPANERDPCVWKSDLPVRTTALLKSGRHLFLGVAPVVIPEDDPHAAYERRRGGELWVCSENDGTRVAQYELESPVVWDGLAAAHGRLYLATTDGRVHCFAESQQD